MAEPQPQTPRLRSFAVNFTHSLLGERVIEAATAEQAVEQYKGLCGGFSSEHPPQVRELSPPMETTAIVDEADPEPTIEAEAEADSPAESEADHESV